jgi:SH3-like domain-containing protein
MSDVEQEIGVSGFTRAVRMVAPWLLLAGVTWAIFGIVSDFSRAAEQLAASGQGSGLPASSSTTAAASVVTTVTNLVAKTRTDVVLRSLPGTSTASVATAKEGTDLEVLARQDGWFRVKDTAGHIGWIPNDVQYVAVRTK